MPIPEDFSTPTSAAGEIDALIHDYVDGALGRRELLRRLTTMAGSVGAAMLLLEREGLAEVPTQTCPDGIRVPENDPSVQSSDVTFPSEDATISALLARPANQKGVLPAVIVIHENRGLTDHIRDVTRRAAKAGFVALGIDLLSRQGGTKQFTNDDDRRQAYGKTVLAERLKDIRAGMEYLDKQRFVRRGFTGAVGFCAGGGNVYASAFMGVPLKAGVAFYGTPPKPLPPGNTVTTSLLCIFSENDKNQSARIPELTEALIASRQSFDVALYGGTGHGFHNDTSPVYNASAACDAWARTVAWLNKHLQG